MKRTLITLAGIVAIGTGAYVANRLNAQQGDVQPANAIVPAPAVQTKIAIVNLNGVVKNYQKWQDFEQVFRNTAKKYDEQFEAQRARGLKLKADLDRATDEAAKEKITVELKGLERTLQDMSEQAKKNLAKYRDEVIVQIYGEIEEAIGLYARSNALELVMHYSDALTQQDLKHPANIQRKFQTVSLMPVYSAPGVDITRAITENLNRKLQSYSNQTPPRNNN